MGLSSWTSMYIIIIIMVLLCLVWIYVYPRVDEYQKTRKNNVKTTIEWLYHAVNDICYRCNMSPIYDIVESKQITYTDKITKTHNIKGTINLVIWDEKHDRIFSYNTLMYAMLHEIAHILSPSVHHEPPFDSIEQILINKAIELEYYDEKIVIESNYMTLDLGTK